MSIHGRESIREAGGAIPAHEHALLLGRLAEMRHLTGIVHKTCSQQIS
jgi:hypothetical protein